LPDTKKRPFEVKPEVKFRHDIIPADEIGSGSVIREEHEEFNAQKKKNVA
jgi:hypothetical protein